MQNLWQFKSLCPCQKSTGFDLSIFYPLRKQWYIITRKRASHHRRCISSAAGCISFRNDDIQNFVLMIYNSCGIDDIHGFRCDLCKSSNSYAKTATISFSAIFAFGELNWLTPAKFASQAKLPAGSRGEYNFALCVSTEFRYEVISLPPNGRQFN